MPFQIQVADEETSYIHSRYSSNLRYRSLLQKPGQRARGEVPAVPDVAVERRHRPARDGDDHAAARRKVVARVDEEGARVVDVFEHF